MYQYENFIFAHLWPILPLGDRGDPIHWEPCDPCHQCFLNGTKFSLRTPRANWRSHMQCSNRQIHPQWCLLLCVFSFTVPLMDIVVIKIRSGWLPLLSNHWAIIRPWWLFACEGDFIVKPLVSIVVDTFSVECKLVIDPHSLPPFSWFFTFLLISSHWSWGYSLYCNRDVRFNQRKLRYNCSVECTLYYLYYATKSYVCWQCRFQDMQKGECIQTKEIFLCQKLVKILQFLFPLEPSF